MLNIIYVNIKKVSGKAQKFLDYESYAMGQQIVTYISIYKIQNRYKNRTWFKKLNWE